MNNETRTKYLLANYGNPLETVNGVIANWNNELTIVSLLNYPKNFRVRLKDKISDEDFLSVARLFCDSANKWDDSKRIKYVKSVINSLIKFTDIADYLRSRGYATAWTVAVEKPKKEDYQLENEIHGGHYWGDKEAYEKALSEWTGYKTYSIEEQLTEGVLIL